MKVIFLDIDGVLNNFNTFKRRREHYDVTGEWLLEIDEQMVERLSDIVKATNAKIVLSSSWRSFFDKDTCKPLNDKGKQLTDILDKYGLKIYSRTGSSKGSRADEIDEWLSNNKSVKNFVILDDDSFDLQKYINKKLVKTSFTTDGEMIMDIKQSSGLQNKHVQLAIKILKGE